MNAIYETAAFSVVDQLLPSQLLQTRLPDGRTLYQFEGTEVRSAVAFEYGQIVRLAPHVPRQIAEELGNIFVVVDDDCDTLVSFSDEIDPDTNSRGVRIPSEDDWCPVICFTLEGRRIEFSREVIVTTGDTIESEALDEMVRRWTRRGATTL